MKIKSYLQNVWAELRRVQWPTASTVGKYFASVIIGVTLATVVIFVFDTVFLRLIALIIT